MDIGSYRLNERLAKAAIPSWRLKAIHGAHVFANAGFPLQVESTDELCNLLDTMQEGRFAQFQAELGGFGAQDEADFVNALVDFCLFFRTHFSGRQAPLPLSTMIAHLLLAKKLRGLRARRILEIGPGCGYLSFFLKSHLGLENYTQIETTESFYILQNLVNKHVFGHRFRECAQGDWSQLAAAPLLDSAANQRAAYIEVSQRLGLETSEICRHYPWWRLGELTGQRFDVVTSNANLNEFTQGAFLQYVWLIDRVLARDGVLLVQDIGGGPLPLDFIVQRLLEIRLVPAVIVNPGALSAAGPAFGLSNFLFVREQHPLFARHAASEQIQIPRFDPDEPLVRAVFSLAEDRSRRQLLPGQIVAAVAERLKKL
jgi:SAM-dependent methyltransferase